MMPTMDATLAICSLLVAVLYFVIGGYIFPRLILSWKALLGAALFFVGCALSHIHWAADLLEPQGAHVSVFMFVSHLIQLFGGSLFVWELHNKHVYMAVSSEDADEASNKGPRG